MQYSLGTNVRSIYIAGAAGSPEFTMSVHNAKNVTVEEVDTSTYKYKHAYADAVIQLALADGDEGKVG